MMGSLIEAHVFGTMEEDYYCGYDHTLIDDSSAQGSDKENCSVGEDDSKDVGIIDTELMQLQVGSYFHEGASMQSELRHVLDVLTNQHENVEMLSYSNVKSIVAYGEMGEFRRWLQFSEVYLLVNW